KALPGQLCLDDVEWPMVTAQPGGSNPGSETTLASIPSDTGMELEAALPSASQRSAQQTPLSSLDEPSGELISPPAPIEIPAEPPPNLPLADRFEHMRATVHANRPHDDLEIIRAAWAFCVQQHDGQLRASGEPYIIHPLEV